MLWCLDTKPKEIIPGSLMDSLFLEAVGLHSWCHIWALDFGTYSDEGLKFKSPGKTASLRQSPSRLPGRFLSFHKVLASKSLLVDDLPLANRDGLPTHWQESFDLQEARRLLDEDHRGLEKVRHFMLLAWWVRHRREWQRKIVEKDNQRRINYMHTSYALCM